MSEPFNFGDGLLEAEKEFGLGSGKTLKFVEGENKIRVLSPGKPVATHRISPKEYHTCYGQDNGCKYHEETSPKPSVKFVMWVIDRTDGLVKLAFMPYTIMKSLRDLQNNPDYEFFELPMPYDITVRATKAGTKEVEYAVIPARNNSELTMEEVGQYAKQKTVDEVIDRMKSKEQNPEVDPEE